MTRKAIITLVFTITLLLTASHANADSITLRAGATVASDRPVTLGDVALLVGDHAQSHADMIIVPDPLEAADGQIWIEVTLKDLRRAMKDAGVAPGPIALSGSRCVVRLLGAAEPIATEPAPIEPNAAMVLDEDAPATIRLRVAQSIARIYAVSLDSVRLHFDERDKEFLDQLELGRRVVVTTGTSTSSARKAVNVRVYAGESVDDARSIGVTVELQQNAIVVTHDVARRDFVASDAVIVRRIWVDAGGSALVTDIKDAIGGIARSDLKAGTVLRASHLESPVLVQRGTLVRVQCLSGGIAMQMQARAKASGKRGDVIELRRDGSDRSFMARVDGENSVVVDLDGTTIAATTPVNE